MREARTRWARVDPRAFRSARWIRVGHERLEELLDEEARASERAPSARARSRCRAGGELGRETRAGAFRARVSNLPHYAVTGVKAQAFVLVLFSNDVSCRGLTQQYQNVMTISGVAVEAGGARVAEGGALCAFRKVQSGNNVVPDECNVVYQYICPTIWKSIFFENLGLSPPFSQCSPKSTADLQISMRSPTRATGRSSCRKRDLTP